MTDNNWKAEYEKKNEEELVQSVFNALRGITGTGNESVRAAVELHYRYKESYKSSLAEQRRQLWTDRIITVFIAIATTLATIYLSK